MNLSSMESKVREATNNEPWGASTTLMAQIAAGTYNYREREEILSFVFKRFTEKAANEWRQIYKALQLLDYMIKNGSERIVDDVRANISLIQMLKSFHYIDSKGRDQGINVRNRSKNLVALLNDDSLIRSERKKARANQHKFSGMSSAAFGGASSISTGFEDDDFSNRVYGDGGVFGARYDDPASEYNGVAGGGGDNFEEYDVEGSSSSTGPGPSRATTSSSKVNASSSSGRRKSQAAAPPPKAPEKDLLGDLLDFDGGSSSNAGAAAAAPAADEGDDDDFDDFQAAPSLQGSTGVDNSANITNNLANLYVSTPAALRQPSQPFIQQQPSYTPASSSALNNTGAVSTGPAKPSASQDAFSNLFSSAKSKTTSRPSASAHGSSASTPANTTQNAKAGAAGTSNSNDDDLFGGFSSNASTEPKNEPKQANNYNGASGEVDLLSF